MKTLITITFLFTYFFTYSQDTTVIDKSKIANDSLKTALSHLKTKVKKIEYDNYVYSSLYEIDTINNIKDSIKICYLTKDKKVIREILTTNIKWSPFTSDSLIKSDSIIRFYNKKGLLEYSENWSFILSNCYDCPEQGMIQYFGTNEPNLQSYFRIEYNEQDKEIRSSLILTIQGLKFRVIKSYDKEGKIKNILTENIEEYQFWD